MACSATMLCVSEVLAIANTSAAIMARASVPGSSVPKNRTLCIRPSCRKDAQSRFSAAVPGQRKDGVGALEPNQCKSPQKYVDVLLGRKSARIKHRLAAESEKLLASPLFSFRCRTKELHVDRVGDDFIGTTQSEVAHFIQHGGRGGRDEGAAVVERGHDAESGSSGHARDQRNIKPEFANRPVISAHQRSLHSCSSKQRLQPRAQKGVRVDHVGLEPEGVPSGPPGGQQKP